MKAYKATYNMKCNNLTYEVGKEYKINNVKMCSHGFHFCLKAIDTLNYYEPTEDFILLEIEILGDIETNRDKSVSNHIKVIRVIPRDEYSVEMLNKFPVVEYDERNNMISQTDSNGSKWTYEYDERNNMISQTYPSGSKSTYEYDERNNMISQTNSYGDKWTYEYDERNNMISQTNSYGDKWTYEYDERNNKISQTDSNGYKWTWEYDERNNKISQTNSYGDKWTYEYGYDAKGNVVKYKDEDKSWEIEII